MSHGASGDFQGDCFDWINLKSGPNRTRNTIVTDNQMYTIVNMLTQRAHYYRHHGRQIGFVVLINLALLPDWWSDVAAAIDGKRLSLFHSKLISSSHQIWLLLNTAHPYRSSRLCCCWCCAIVFGASRLTSALKLLPSNARSSVKYQYY